MKLSRIYRGTSGSKPGCLGFTLAEILAAMMFMAIVLPAAVEGVRLAARAGEVGTRKAVAVRIAERVLGERVIMQSSVGTSMRGSVQEGVIVYEWTLRTTAWREGSMTELTAEVTFPVQGKDYTVRMTTLVDSSTR